jgi:tetratricopeptide (TPR) repeat protein
MSAIAQRYAMEDRFEDAIAWARRIDRKSKYGPNALRIIGQSLIDSSTPSDPRDSTCSPVAANRLKEAIDVLEEAAVDAKAQGEYVLALESRYSQLDAARILGDTERAESIIDEGLWLAEKYPVALGQFLLARSQFYTRRGDAKRALRDAEKAIALVSSPTAKAILAVCLWNRNEGSDRVMARREMARLLEIVTGYQLEQYTGLLLRGCIFDGLFSEAQDVLLVAERRGLDSAAISAYRAQIAHAKNVVDDARQLALAAAQQIGEGTSRSTRQLVAEILVTVGFHSEVVPILETLASRSELTVDTRNLIRAAFHAERHQLVLEWCDSLRQADVWDDELLKVELNLLERYDAIKAIQVIEAALLRMPDNRGLKVRRCLVGIRLQRPDLVKLTPDDVPPASEVDLDHLPATVECLMYNSFYSEAIDYAYCCVHRFPNEPGAHMAFIRCILFLPREQLSLAEPVEVCIGSAVKYQEDGCDRSVWHVIEHELPLSFSDMVESNTRIAKALLGHRVGDKIVLAGGMARDRTAAVLEVRNK